MDLGHLSEVPASRPRQGCAQKGGCSKLEEVQPRLVLLRHREAGRKLSETGNGSVCNYVQWVVENVKRIKWKNVQYVQWGVWTMEPQWRLMYWGDPFGLLLGNGHKIPNHCAY
eukprot:5014285-Amphidinium_carterae.1